MLTHVMHLSLYRQKCHAGWGSWATVCPQGYRTSSSQPMHLPGGAAGVDLLQRPGFFLKEADELAGGNVQRGGGAGGVVVHGGKTIERFGEQGGEVIVGGVDAESAGPNAPAPCVAGLAGGIGR